MMKPRTSWLSEKLVIRRSKIHRRGVFARQRVKNGERVAIFGGEIMLIDEIDALPARLQEYPMQIEERFVLGSRFARAPEPTDFFNHSCRPNCGFKGQIFLVAMRDIAKDDEVTFDYAMVVSESVGSQILFEMECNCGARNCRKRITEEDWRLPTLQRRYGGHFSQYLEEKINSARSAGSKKRNRSRAANETSWSHS